MKFNEDSRVKIPAILHLCRLGYQYLPLKEAEWDTTTNIFPNLFVNAITRLNPGLEEQDAERLLTDISILLDNEDLGKAFYKKLVNASGDKLIDFDNFHNNTFHVVTELPYVKDDEEFRPDITILVNGMPLVFIEVKKPNNPGGIQAERTRMAKRFGNPKFRRFVNITQMMIFSNNMEYDPTESIPLSGAFYATTSFFKPMFNYFREEEKFDLDKILLPEDDHLETEVLKDNNLVVIKNSEEFQENKNPNSPTNRIITSLLSRERLAFILKYAIAYVNDEDGLQKHIMRYPQLFGTKAIEQKLEEGVKKGVIWHTQGSGKTALAYYSVAYLTDYFSKKGIIPKFYFIVDRIDLLRQAFREFKARGLTVHLVDSRSDFVKSIKTQGALHNHSGNSEITVVNIQKFSEESNVVKTKDYDINIQRIYFLDEVHRSYDPKGSFLANLTQSDPDSIKIGLTGTPLISSDYYTRDLFGDYIHKYYYNASIADGYTLRLIREEIASDYKIVLQKALEKIEVVKGHLDQKKIFAHRSFITPLLEYIVDDFSRSRLTYNDKTIGGMVICASSEQAKALHELFQLKYVGVQESNVEYAAAADKVMDYKTQFNPTSAALILHDIGTKEDRENWVESFKSGNIDLLFVYNMLLTGFDAPRLKKLYMGRVIRQHNLLQALTRVNRRYKDFKYGYVVDFADIRSEFDATNRAYFEELQKELGDEMESYSNLFLSEEEIEEEIAEIKETLFHYNTSNAEIFSQQIQQISNREEMLAIRKALLRARELYNLMRLMGHYDMLDKLDFRKLSALYQDAENHLALLNTREALENDYENTNLLNIALEDVVFRFTKVSEEELLLAESLKDSLQKARESMAGNFDKKDPEFVSLYEELKRLFGKKKLDEVSQDEMRANIGTLNEIYEKIKELNRQNENLKQLYQNDPKFARVHKRLHERGDITEKESIIHEALMSVKAEADLQVLQNRAMLQNEGFFKTHMMRLVINQFKTKHRFDLDAATSRYINDLIVKEYIDEFHGRVI